jgi:uncharacterized membrane protein
MIAGEPSGGNRPGGSAAREPSAVVLVSWIARAVLVAIGVFPWCLPLLHAAWQVSGSAFDWPFLLVCHRMPSRTLHIAGVLMPVCSRCAGIFAGLAAGSIVARPRLPIRTWRMVGAVTAGLMIADVVMQDWGVHPVWHPSRLATGVLLGYVMAAAFVTNLAGPWGPSRRQSPKAM